MWVNSIANANDSQTPTLFPATRESAALHNREIYELESKIQRLNVKITELEKQLKESSDV